MVAISIPIPDRLLPAGPGGAGAEPQGAGLAAGFTGAQQMRRAAHGRLPWRASWTLAVALMVLCLIASSIKPEASDLASEPDAPVPRHRGRPGPGCREHGKPGGHAASEALKSLEDEEETN